MKKFLIAPCVGACALLLFPACKSTDKDGYGETALPMSEVADGEIPPWLLEDDGSHGGPVYAGSRTPSYADRNSYPTPEPHEMASAGSTRQNQPRVANNAPVNTTDDTVIEKTVLPPTETDPLASAHTAATSTPTYTGTTTTAKSPGRKGGKGGNNLKPGKKPKTPTMIVYKVRPGDNLSEIAARSNTTVAQIRRDSNLKSTTIYPGQTIKVRFTPKGYKETKGTGKATGSGKGGATHKVTPGQTLSGIAKRYGVTTSQLMKANNFSKADADRIRPGQTITIPKKPRKR